MSRARKKCSAGGLDGRQLNPERSFTLSLRPHECAFLEGLLNEARLSFRLEDQRTGESFGLKVRSYEYVLLEGLLREARQWFSCKNRGWGFDESFSLKVRPYEYALVEGLLRDVGRSFVFNGPGLDSDQSFTLTVGPYDYQLLSRQAVVTFALFLPLHTGAVRFDQGKNTYLYRPDRGISGFVHHDSCRKAVEGPASTHLYPLQGGELKGWVSPPRRGWGEFRKPGRAGLASYAQVFFLPAPVNRKEIFRAVPCCYEMAFSLRQSSWVDLHMLKRYLL